jgi:hypothetical protein
MKLSSKRRRPIVAPLLRGRDDRRGCGTGSWRSDWLSHGRGSPDRCCGSRRWGCGNDFLTGAGAKTRRNANCQKYAI